MTAVVIAGVVDSVGAVSFAATVAVLEFEAGSSRGRHPHGLAARRTPQLAAASCTAVLPPPHVVAHRCRCEFVAWQRVLALCAEVGVAPQQCVVGCPDLRPLWSSLRRRASLVVGRRDDAMDSEKNLLLLQK